MIRICENVKMFDRPPLLEEPFAQTLSEKTGELELETRCAMVGLVLCCFGLWLRRVMAIKTRRRIAFDMFSGNDILLWPLPFGFIWYKFKET